MEVGLGVHGEAGASTQPMQPASAIAAQVQPPPALLLMLALLVAPRPGQPGHWSHATCVYRCCLIWQ